EKIPRLTCKGGHFGTARNDPWPRAVSRRAYADHATEVAWPLDRRDGRGWLQGRLCADVAGWPCPDRLGVCAVSCDRLDRRLVSSQILETHHRRADAAGGDPGGGVLYPRPHLYRGEAPDAGRRQTVGGVALARQWRSRFDHTVRLVFGMGSVRPHIAQAPR